MAKISASALLLSTLFTLTSSIFLRLLYMRLATRKHSKVGPSHLVAVLGSGGHTAEMMSLLRDIDPTQYTHRTYIVSSGDDFSSGKAAEIERLIQSKHSSWNTTREGETNSLTGRWVVSKVPRARKIHQPLYTTPISSIWCLIGCLNVLSSPSTTAKAIPPDYPDVIIINGPATAVMVVVAAFILRFLAFAPVEKMKIIYVESWARVKTLSLSGKLLLISGAYDRFYVQWEALAKSINGNKTRKKVEWAGFLVE